MASRRRGTRAQNLAKSKYSTVSKKKRSRRNKKRLANAKFTGRSMRPTVFPLRFTFNTRYVDTYKSLTSTPGQCAQYVISCNGLWDPDISGTGHQPIGFDQMMLFYDHYTVIAAKIKVFIQNESDQHPIIAAIMITDDATIGANNIGTLIENGSCKWKRLERQGSDANFINNIKSSCTFTKTVAIKKFLGRPNILSEDDLRGNVNSNPDEQLFFKILCQSISGTADAITVSFCTQVDYVAILTEPRIVQPS